MTVEYAYLWITVVRALSLILLGLVCTVAARSQVDSNTLRSTFGPPIRTTSLPPRDVFRVDGLDITVDYSSRHRKVCSIEIQSGIADTATVELVLGRAVPLSTRGKMWNQLEEFDGLFGFLRTYYEKVIITEDISTSRGLRSNKPGIRVSFKDKECNWKDQDDPFDAQPSPASRKFK